MSMNRFSRSQVLEVLENLRTRELENLF
jgi:hypothetical protein